MTAGCCSRAARTMLPEVWDAKQRGVLFDVGHGCGSFDWSIYQRATAQGFRFDSDQHRSASVVRRRPGLRHAHGRCRSSSTRACRSPRSLPRRPLAPARGDPTGGSIASLAVGRRGGEHRGLPDQRPDRSTTSTHSGAHGAGDRQRFVAGAHQVNGGEIVPTGRRCRSGCGHTPTPTARSIAARHFMSAAG